MNVEKLVDEYAEKAVATKYYYAFLDGENIYFYDIPEADNFKIWHFPGVCKPDTKTDKRRKFSGEKQASQLRLKKTAFRNALCTLYGDNRYKCPFYVGSITVDEWEKFKADFCSRFDCVLRQKDDGTHYTIGDCAECLCFERINGNSDKWYKNTRCYARGTDCAEYEIKSFIGGDPTITPAVNQWI